MSILKTNFWSRADGIKHNSVVQVETKIINSRGSYSSPVNSQTIIEPLSIGIKPIYKNSIIIVEWMVNGELHQDNVFRIFKDDFIASNGQNIGAQGRWVGYTSAFYDQNQDSTPSNWSIVYVDTPGTTSTVNYQLAVGSSSSSAFTFYLNRTVASSDTGQDAYERMVSSAVAWEITQ
jgi:hypothetical protein